MVKESLDEFGKRLVQEYEGIIQLLKEPAKKERMVISQLFEKCLEQNLDSIPFGTCETCTMTRYCGLNEEQAEILKKTTRGKKIYFEESGLIINSEPWRVPAFNVTSRKAVILFDGKLYNLHKTFHPAINLDASLQIENEDG